MISSAWARNSVVDTGSSGGGNALLIMLAAGITFGFAYAAYKRWRRRNEDSDYDVQTPPQ